MFLHKRSVILFAFITGLFAVPFSYAAGSSFSVSFPKSRSEQPLDGRIFFFSRTTRRPNLECRLTTLSAPK